MTVVGGRREFDSPFCLGPSVLGAQKPEFGEVCFYGSFILSWEGDGRAAPITRQRSMQTGRHGRDRVPMANG